MFAATASVISADRAAPGVYKPRNPAASHYFQCVAAHWEELEPAWYDLYQRQDGYFRPYVREVKRLRPWVMHDRELLAGLSKCVWKILGWYLKYSLPYDEAVAGVVAVQTFGDFQNFNPHLHIIATDGCFYGQGQFLKANRPCPADLEPLFRQEVFKQLKAHGLPDRVIENMMGWHHAKKRGQFHLIDEECGIACNILPIK